MPSPESLIDEFQNMAQLGRYAEILERVRLLTGFDQLYKIYWSLFAYENLGQTEDAIEYYKMNELVIRNDEREDFKTKIWNTVGSIYYKNGEPLTAYEFFQRAFQSAISLNLKEDLSVALNSLGTVNVTRGDMAKGLEFYEKCLQNAIKQEDLILQSNTLYNIGTIHFYRNEFEKAEEYYLKSLDLRRTIGNDTRISLTLRGLVELEFASKAPDFDSVNAYLEELKEFANNRNTHLIDLYYLSSKAMVSKWYEEYFKAEMIFRRIIDDHQEIDITVSSILNLIEILFIRYKETPQEKILDDIHKFLDKMFEISKQQFSFRYLVKSLILKSQLLSIEGNFDEAYVLIEKALKSTEDHKMDYLRQEIVNLRDSLVSEYNKLKDLYENNSTVLSRLESSSIMEYLLEKRDV